MWLNISLIEYKSCSDGTLYEEDSTYINEDALYG